MNKHKDLAKAEMSDNCSSGECETQKDSVGLLTTDDLRTISKLAYISVPESEMEIVRNQLADTLQFVAKLSSVDTSEVEPTSHVHGVVNAFRDDVVKPSLPLSEVENIAPEFVNSGFRVPKVI